MSTNFGFAATTDAIGVMVSGRSLGAHLAAKLENFGSDERTLTDELCDMLCIWLSNSPPTGPTFLLRLKKTTVKQERKNGADLRLIVDAPDGVKDCLLQAKVLDPATGRLRCATPAGYASLRKQLKKARVESGSLAFLLVYVPAQHLDGAHHGFGSWEQSFCGVAGAPRSSAYGATVVPVDRLLDATGNWIDPINKVPHSGGVFASGMPFAQLLLELLVCFRGQWRSSGEIEQPVRRAAVRHGITFGVSIEPQASWEELRESARAAIGQAPAAGAPGAS